VVCDALFLCQLLACTVLRLMFPSHNNSTMYGDYLVEVAGYYIWQGSIDLGLNLAVLAVFASIYREFREYLSLGCFLLFPVLLEIYNIYQYDFMSSFTSFRKPYFGNNDCNKISFLEIIDAFYDFP